MSLINRLPFGFQSLLDSKTLGKNPGLLNQEVRPVLDMERFFKPPLLRRAQATGTWNAVGSSAQVSVPSNELWEIWSVEAGALNNFAAGASGRININLQLPDPENAAGLIVGRIAHFPAPTILNAGSTAVRWGGEYQPPFKFILPPGSVIQASLEDLDLNGGVSVAGSLSVWHHRYTY